MSWHYRMRKRSINGEPWFDLVEYYTEPEGWTKESMAPGGETKEECLNELQRMLQDALAYPVLEDNEQ